MIARRLRPMLVMGISLMALVLAVQPVAAATVTSSSGTYGMYQIHDDHDTTRGANCDYKTTKHNGAYALKDIGVRAPTIYAREKDNSNQRKWVGWKYAIQQDANRDGSGWQTVFTSSVAKAKATESDAANFGRRTWTVPSGMHLQGNYRAQVTLLWYKAGSSTIVKGKVVALIDYYHVKGGGTDLVRQTDCYKSNVDLDE